MTGDTHMVDINTDGITTNDSGSESSSGSGSGSGGRGGNLRTNVFVKTALGTTCYDKHTGCDECGKRAVGVLYPDCEPEERGLDDDGTPLCGKHRNHVRDADDETWQENVFERFVD